MIFSSVQIGKWLSLHSRLMHLMSQSSFSVPRFMQLISLVPTDPGILQRMGEIFDGEDRSQAFQYYYEVSTMVRLWGELHLQSSSYSPIATVRPISKWCPGLERITWSPSTATKPYNSLTKQHWFSECMHVCIHRCVPLGHLSSLWQTGPVKLTGSWWLLLATEK